MYNFVDTTESPGALPLPAEAMSYGGVYIENEIEGYRTLYVEGREMITAAIEATETHTRHGASFRNMRYEPRTLIVGFQLICETAAGMMESYNRLLHILSKKQAQIIFYDEQDKFYTGTKTKITNTPPGRLAVTGEIEIYCANPFKYSVQEYEATAANGVITVDYGGTYPAHPILTAQSEAHDCGFYSFEDKDGHIIRVGNPAEEDQEEVPSETALKMVDTQFGSGHDELYPWSRALARLLYGYYTDNYSADISANYIYSNTEFPGAEPDYYYGPAYGAYLAEPIPNFNVSFTHWFEPSGNQGGGFDFYINNQGGSNIAGVSIYRNKGGRVQVSLIVKGNVVKQMSYSLADNPFKGAWRTQTIAKSLGTVTFNVGGVSYSVTDPALAGHAYDAYNPSFVFYRQPGAEDIGINNALQAALFYGYENEWEDIANKIPQNGLIEVDAGSGEISLNGASRPDLGSVNNDFEDFELDFGSNIITCNASDWVNDAVYSMKYREVFL